VRTQKRATEQDIRNIFCYRGAGFSMDEIASFTGLARHTVSYQLKKLKYSVNEGEIDDLLLRLNLGDRSEFDRLESMYELQISRLTEENFQMFQELKNSRHKSIEELSVDDMRTQGLFPHSENESSPLVVIDAIDVISVSNSEEIDGEQTTVFRYEVGRLKSMIDFLENRGHRVISCMTISTHSFLLSTEDFCTEEDKKTLIRMENSGKLRILDDYEPYYREGLVDSDTLVTNNQILSKFITNAKITTYQWQGPEPTLDNLPTIEEEIYDGDTDDQIRAKGLVLAILSERDSKNGKIKVPEIHVILASEFLGLKRSNQINWHKGWPSQLKDKLNLSGKTFRDQLKRLMGDDIYIEKPQTVRRNYPDN